MLDDPQTQGRPESATAQLSGDAGRRGRASLGIDLGLRIVGAILLVASGLIHLYLWAGHADYRDVATIGPLFAIQGISGVILALALVALGRRILSLAGAAYMAASIGGLLASVRWGLFGYNETMGAPYVGIALGVEVAGLVLLLASGLWGGVGKEQLLGRTMPRRPQNY
jgi:hypothetical protein